MKPLTAAGGRFELMERERKIVCLTPDNKLYINAAHKTHPAISVLKQRLDKCNHVYQTIEVSAEFIHRLYADANSAQDVDGKKSRQQIDYRKLLKDAFDQKASDIHIVPHVNHGTRIYYRILGDMEHQTLYDRSYTDGEELCRTIYQALADVTSTTFNPSEFQDARIAQRDKLFDGLHGIRIATAPTAEGFMVVMRLIYAASNVTSLTTIGVLDDQKRMIELLTKLPNGLTIISGPTGSGKSTLLSTILSGLYTSTAGKKHILTLEDPPEYPIDGVRQIPVSYDTAQQRDEAFRKALRGVMRIDPDILMLGEIRDHVSAHSALEFSMTGHQVWSTVHANSPVGILFRLRDLGVDQNLLTDPTIVRGLVSLRLVKTLCPHCKIKLRDAEKKFTQRDIDRIYRAVPHANDVCIKGDGCSYCGGRGYAGRTAVTEVIVTDERMMELVRANDMLKLNQYLRHVKHAKTMLQVAIIKIAAGDVDPFAVEEVFGPLVMGSIEEDGQILSEEINHAL